MMKQPMMKPHLHIVLADRTAINILKALHETEYLFRTSHFLKLSDIQSKLALGKKPFKSIELLESVNLIMLDKSDSDELILTLTNKGRIFFETFDNLHTVFLDELDRPRPIKMEYDLKPLEKKILVICLKIQRESGASIPLLNLVQEVYPNDFPEKKRSTILRNCSKLEKLNLIKKETFQQINYFSLTESGKRVVLEQLIKTF